MSFEVGQEWRVSYSDEHLGGLLVRIVKGPTEDGLVQVERVASEWMHVDSLEGMNVMAEDVTAQAPAMGACFVAARIVHQVAVHARRDERTPEADWLDRLSVEVRSGEPDTWDLTRALAPTRKKTGAGRDRD